MKRSEKLSNKPKRAAPLNELVREAWWYENSRSLDVFLAVNEPGGIGAARVYYRDLLPALRRAGLLT